MKNQVGKFINREAARAAAVSFFMAASSKYELVTMGQYTQPSPIEVCIHMEGRMMPIIEKMTGYYYSRREIRLHKREDWTNYCCITYYFSF